MAATRISRRRLAAAVVGAVAPAALARQDEKKPAATPLALSAGSLLEIVRLRHGKQLDEARTEQVRQALVSGLESAARLAKVTITSADEPAFVFQADWP